MDLTAETFATALTHRRQFAGHSAEEEQGWLFAIARSQLSHYWRRGAVERTALNRLAVDVPELSEDELRRVEELAELVEIRPHVTRELGRLPVDQRRAIDLRVVQELPYPAVAEALGVSEQTARARVSRGLRAMSQALRAVPALEEAA